MNLISSLSSLNTAPARWLSLLPLAALLLLASGCENVKPWQRGKLADYTMRADRDPLRTTQAEHIWFSREATSGGGGVGGGGCGCN
jgi:hypothetical protein